jgi:uncharacterized protein
MIRNTFCHLPGISSAAERGFWSEGVVSWADLRERLPARVSATRRTKLEGRIAESVARLRAADPLYFAGLLSSKEHWRLLGEFRESIGYLDIETTGLGGAGDHITTIALYDGRRVRHYIHGQNLADFQRDVQECRVLVTYNGKCFDVPFIERTLGFRLPQAHVDLRYVLKSLGYSGGLKAVEKRLGMERDELEGVDGFLAVLLWREYQRSGNKDALETLLAYNVQDVLSLESLMVFAYNRKLDETPFSASHALPPAEPTANPFRPHPAVIRQCLGSGWMARW